MSIHTDNEGALVRVSNRQDLEDLVVLVELWFRSPLETRGQLDQAFIGTRLLEVTLNHKTCPMVPMYPDVCICGQIINSEGSRLRRWCTECYGHLGQWLPPIQCEAWILEYAISWAVWNCGHRIA